MRTMFAFRSNPVGEAVFATSRQIWLASLGAAAVSRDWAKSEATEAFLALVKEGTSVESRAIRLLDNRIEASLGIANSVWRQARAGVRTTVRDVAGGAITLVRDNLPRSLPKISIPSRVTVRAKSVNANRAKPARTVRAAKTIKATSSAGNRVRTK